MAVERLENATRLLNFAEGSYFERTSRPVYSLVFLLPFITFYELAVILLNSTLLQQSNVLVDTFVWLQKLLEFVHIEGKMTWLAPPLVVVVFLLALQFTCRKRWSVRLGDIIPMNIECVLLAVPLIFLSLLINSSAFVPKQQSANSNPAVSNEVSYSAARCVSRYGNNTREGTPTGSAMSGSEGKRANLLFTNVVTGIGAGIYEELVFRLILISCFMIVFQDLLRFGKLESVVISVVLSALLFSLHHHIDFVSGQVNSAQPFHLAKFIFRTVAGVYFAGIFAIRRFGITAGTHAFYNIIAVITNAVFFGD